MVLAAQSMFQAVRLQRIIVCLKKSLKITQQKCHKPRKRSLFANPAEWQFECLEPGFSFELMSCTCDCLTGSSIIIG